MKKHIMRLGTAILLLALLPAMLLFAGASLPSYYQESYYAILPQMYQRLENVKERKIVVIGGSNVAFGIDTAFMESLLAQKGFDYEVCSFGLYAAVGTSAMLDLSIDTLKDGDIVILAIEPTSQTMSTYFGSAAFWKCSEDAPELLLHVSTEKKSALFGSYIPYLQERFSILRSGDLPMAEGVYAKASFNERCDLVFDRQGNTMAVGYDTSSLIDLSAVNIEPAFMEQVNDYCAAAQQRGAAVYMSFSPMNRSALQDASEKVVFDYFTGCNQAFICPIISNPNDYILDSGWFYDSNFHLNSAGAILRTCLLTEDILAYLGCFDALDYDIPTMPASIVQMKTDDESTIFFNFEPVAGGEGYLISGLTEDGLNQEHLTAASSYQGKPVIGFSPNALTDATVLTELRLPESIETLPDYLFQNCTNLTRLILEHRSVPCGITGQTFDGADRVRIFVPSDAFHLYRDGYGCESNPWIPYLNRIFTF